MQTFPDLQMASSCVLSWKGEREYKRTLSGVSPYKGANPTMGALPSGSHLNLSKAPSPNNITWVIRASHVNFEKTFSP